MQTTTEKAPPGPPMFKLNPIARAALKAQVFLIRKNMAGPLGEIAMALTHTGRKSGKSFSIPVAFLRDGNDIIALNTAGMSNWYKNVLAAGQATINIQGEESNVKVRAIDDPAEIARVFELYKQTFKGFARTFGVPVDAPEAELIKARDRFRYVRMTRV